jgi:hypothetical protein
MQAVLSETATRVTRSITPTELGDDRKHQAARSHPVASIAVDTIPPVSIDRKLIRLHLVHSVIALNRSRSVFTQCIP